MSFTLAWILIRFFYGRFSANFPLDWLRESAEFREFRCLDAAFAAMIYRHNSYLPI